MRDPRLVTVTWHDAHGAMTLVYQRERDHMPTVMYTIGWLLDQDKAGVSLACERFQEDGQWCYRGYTFIPLGMVVKVQRLR